MREEVKLRQRDQKSGMRFRNWSYDITLKHYRQQLVMCRIEDQIGVAPALVPQHLLVSLSIPYRPCWRQSRPRDILEHRGISNTVGSTCSDLLPSWTFMGFLGSTWLDCKALVWRHPMSVSVELAKLLFPPCVLMRYHTSMTCTALFATLWEVNTLLLKWTEGLQPYVGWISFVRRRLWLQV